MPLSAYNRLSALYAKQTTLRESAINKLIAWQDARTSKDLKDAGHLDCSDQLTSKLWQIADRTPGHEGIISRDQFLNWMAETSECKKYLDSTDQMLTFTAMISRTMDGDYYLDVQPINPGDLGARIDFNQSSLHPLEPKLGLYWSIKKII